MAYSFMTCQYLANIGKTFQNTAVSGKENSGSFGFFALAFSVGKTKCA
jgi:hypothetical protein